MSIKVIVFDFDGTLVNSNKIKYDAYFDIFPNNEDNYKIIKEVLDKSYEATRYINIKKILDKIFLYNKNLKSQEYYVQRYSDIVLEKVQKCNDMPFAQELLEKLKLKYTLYLSSTTPQSALEEIIRYKNWENYFKNIYGYPKNKIDTLKEIIINDNISEDEIMVIGDGKSDRESANIIGCHFIDVNTIKLENILNLKVFYDKE